MVVDTLLALVFFWKARTLPLFLVIPALLGIFAIELTFLAANGLKLANGGYMPVLIGATIILLMVIWMRGPFCSWPPSSAANPSSSLAFCKASKNASPRAWRALPYSCRPIPSMRPAPSCTI